MRLYLLSSRFRMFELSFPTAKVGPTLLPLGLCSERPIKTFKWCTLMGFNRPHHLIHNQPQETKNVNNIYIYIYYLVGKLCIMHERKIHNRIIPRYWKGTHIKACIIMTHIAVYETENAQNNSQKFMKDCMHNLNIEIIALSMWAPTPQQKSSRGILRF